MIYLFVATLVYFVLAGAAAPWNADRYIMPIMPLLSIIIPYVIMKMIGHVLKSKTICVGFIAIFVIVLCAHWHIRIKPYYLYNDSERVEYMNRCHDYYGVIIDSKTEPVLCEIELNFKHPQVYETNDENYYNLETVLSDNQQYMLYIGKNTEVEEIENTLISRGFLLDKSGVETDFFNIYSLEKK
jgi:hypothetical protein